MFNEDDDDVTADRARRSGVDRRSAGDTDPRKSLGFVLALISLITTIFLAGYNWRQVSDSASVLAKIPETYQSKDVADVQYRALVEQLVEVRKQIDRLQATVDRPVRQKE